MNDVPNIAVEKPRWLKARLDGIVGLFSLTTLEGGKSHNDIITEKSPLKYDLENGVLTFTLGSEKRAVSVEMTPNDGGESYSLEMKLGKTYRFGPSYGHRIKSWEEERHPLKKIMRLLGIPVKPLTMMKGSNDKKGQLKLYSEKNIAEKTVTWITDGVISSEQNEYRFIRDCNWVVRKVEWPDGNTYIDKLYVWPSCDRETFYKAMKPFANVEINEWVERAFDSIRNSKKEGNKKIRKKSSDNYTPVIFGIRGATLTPFTTCPDLDFVIPIVENKPLEHQVNAFESKTGLCAFIFDPKEWGL